MKLNKAYTRYSLLIVFGIFFTILLIPSSEASAVVLSDNFNDNDITDWLVTGYNNNDAIADNGRMRLRVWRCSDVAVSKDLGFLSGKLIIDFDSETYAEDWSEDITWKLIVNGITIINEGGSSGHIKKDLNVNGNVQLKFSIHEGKNCPYHKNTYLWVDNLDLKLIPPKSSSLSLTKSASPYSLRQFQESTIKVLIENSGTTEVKTIEIMDSIHPSFDLIGGDFTNPKKFDSIRVGESREIQYTIKSKESGAFTLDPATVTYADSEGNIQEVKSEAVSIKVVPSSDGGSSGTNTGQNSRSASVSLHGEKTDVVMGEDILFRLSAVNLITKPKMHVQVIIIPPSGMSVTSSEFSKSAAGQFTANYELEPGDGKDIEVRIRSNQVGDFKVDGRIIYYFGDDKENAEDHTLNLPIKVRKDAVQTAPAVSADVTAKAPGFEMIAGIIGLLLLAIILKGKW